MRNRLILQQLGVVFKDLGSIILKKSGAESFRVPSHFENQLLLRKLATGILDRLCLDTLRHPGSLLTQVLTGPITSSHCVFNTWGRGVIRINVSICALEEKTQAATS